MKIAIIGLGLIGGSLAKAFRHYTDHYIIGCDRDKPTLSAALASGAVHEVSETVPAAELYFLALPPSAAVEYLTDHAGEMQTGAIVTDVCGVKAVITGRCEQLCNAHGLRFVGGHPMAGREVSGFSNAVHDLFVNRSYIITSTPHTDPKAAETLRQLVLSIGIDRITSTTPEHHDRMIAFTSQLPHVMAGAYMKSPASREHNGYSAGSYHDVSRVSSVDEHLWSELFIDNRENLAAELRILIENLQRYLTAVEAGDRDALFELVRESRLLKENDLKKNGNEKPHQFG